MKSKDFAEVLRRFADVYSAGPEFGGQDIRHLAEVFERTSAATVSTALKRLQSASTGPSATTRTIRQELESLQRLLEFVGKPAVVKDLADVVRFLSDHPIIDVASIREPGKAGSPSRRPRSVSAPTLLRQDIVDGYVQQLEEVLGDEFRFARVFSILESDSELRPPEVREIAKKFAGASGRSRPESMRKIWNRHQNILSIAARARATAGRSAA